MWLCSVNNRFAVDASMESLQKNHRPFAIFHTPPITSSNTPFFAIHVGVCGRISLKLVGFYAR